MRWQSTERKKRGRPRQSKKLGVTKAIGTRTERETSTKSKEMEFRNRTTMRHYKLIYIYWKFIVYVTCTIHFQHRQWILDSILLVLHFTFENARVFWYVSGFASFALCWPYSYYRYFGNAFGKMLLVLLLSFYLCCLLNVKQEPNINSVSPNLRPNKYVLF